MDRILKYVFPFGLVLLIGVLGLSAWSIRRLTQAVKAEGQANTLQDNADQLLFLLQTAESGPRQYLLTGRPDSLLRYSQSLPQIAESAQRVGDAIGTREHLAVASLKRKISEKLNELNSIIEMTNEGRRQEAINVMAQGERLTNEIHDDLTALDESAKAEAATADAFVQRYANTLLQMIYWGSALALSLLCFFAYMSRMELRRRARTETALKAAESAATVASRLKSQFLATVSHEVRTPLNGIIGMSDLLRTRLREPEHRRFVDIIHNSGDALLRIVNDILDFSKIEAGRIDFEFTDFSVLESVEQTSELFSIKVREKNVVLTTYVDPQIPEWLTGDGSRVAQVLRNLIGNAVKFTERGGILVRAIHRFESGEKVAVRFDIIDSGPGIPAQEKALLFQPFTQVSTSAKRTDGTGLGLSICKNLVEQMGGLIGVDSEVGRGSTFWFEIPFRRSEKPVTDQPRFEGSKPDAIFSVGGTALLDETIARYAGEFGIRTRVLDTLSGIAAPPEAVLIFLNPDGMTEARAAAEIAFAATWPKAEVILLTSDPFAESYRALMSAPVIGFLREPFTRKNITRAIHGELKLPSSGEQFVTADTRATKSGNLILLAEDNSTNQILAQAMIEDLGHQVHTVANGHEVLEALSRIQYDLILMDCQMPVMDGFETARVIRTNEQSVGTHTPIIALTANASARDRERCLAVGMDDFLSKPFRTTELSAVLSKFLKQSVNPIDWTVLSGLVKKTDPGLAKRLIDSFVVTLPNALARIEGALRENNAETVRQFAHQLRSSCSALGARELAEICELVERRVEDGESLAQIKSETERLLSQGQAVHEAFRSQTAYL